MCALSHLFLETFSLKLKKLSAKIIGTWLVSLKPWTMWRMPESTWRESHSLRSCQQECKGTVNLDGKNDLLQLGQSPHRKMVEYWWGIQLFGTTPSPSRGLWDTQEFLSKVGKTLFESRKNDGLEILLSHDCSKFLYGRHSSNPPKWKTWRVWI